MPNLLPILFVLIGIAAVVNVYRKSRDWKVVGLLLVIMVVLWFVSTAVAHVFFLSSRLRHN